MLTVNVDLGDRGYPIHIGAKLLQNAELLAPHVGQGKLLIVTNEAVAPLYLETLRQALGLAKVDHFILPDGEQHKTVATVESIYQKLLADKYDRSSTLIALGGGVVGDITGFAAATYQRGVNFIQIPTTLLAQVDSSVGGKTGVNHELGKNMIGAFHQPVCVLADSEVLNTLPLREIRAGLAEVIKYGLIDNPDFFSWLEQNVSDLLALKPALIAQAVKVSCEEKAAIVARDEREAGVRALLNLGHTFGHAIETAMGYGNWLHGEAVATGMVMAADLSRRLQWIDNESASRIKTVLESFGMPVAPPADITEKQYLNLMASDKKAQQGNIRLILLRGIGDAVIADNVDPGLLSATLGAGANLCHE